MAGLNKVQLIGRLGKDPELRYTQNNTALVKFSLATSEQYTGPNGDRQEKTAWHQITIFGKQAETANRYLRKGRQVYIEGRIEYGSYEDRQGIKRYTTDIIANRFLFLGGKDDNSGGGFGPASGSTHESSSQSYGAPAQSYGEKQPQNYDIPEGDQFADEDIPF
ncbi:MAG: single-stranded DNA-binding protein [Acidobacteria bacterium]|nr:MAG: single-stranded DNA-binding protein [Acidobacteriota bacterium]PIE90123.1 MAG: single-stranded DNA-binding protein [Acidobacteriota bacterium]